MKDDGVYLEQILECIQNIREFVSGMDNAAFLQDRKTQSAVILQLALVGELAKRVSANAKSAIDISWRQIAGFRDRAIHDYFQIDLQIAWDTIGLDLDPLFVAISEYLAKNR